jgi:hypothetical protein
MLDTTLNIRPDNRLNNRLKVLVRRVFLGATAISLGATLMLVPVSPANSASAASTSDKVGQKPTGLGEAPYDLARAATRDAGAQALLAELTSSLPADWHSRLLAAQGESRIGDEVTRRLQSAINPDDYACGPTQFDSYVSRILRGVDNQTLYALGTAGVFDFPAYDAIYFGKPGKGYRLSGKQGRQLNRSFSDLQSFWDIKSNNIDLLGMQSSMVVNKARVARLAREVFRAKPRKAERFAKAVVRVVKSEPSLKRGRNPIFTLNAIAFTGKGLKNKRLRRVGDRIVYGSGLIRALQSMGYGKVGPRSVLAHEFGHHIQFDRKLIASPLRKAEAGRRVELMADTFATYFVGHRKGLKASATLQNQSVASFKLVGDCGFDDSSHHGTPNQRAAAASFGIQLADSSGSTIRKGRSVGNSFDAQLPTLVAPDAV